MGTLQAQFLLDTQINNCLNQNGEPKGRNELWHIQTKANTVSSPF